MRKILVFLLKQYLAEQRKFFRKIFQKPIDNLYGGVYN